MCFFSNVNSRLIALAFVLCAGLAVTGPASAQGIDTGSTAENVFNLLNAYRSQNGRSQLNHRDELRNSVKVFADFIAQSGDFSHTAGGKGFGDRAREAGYNCPRGENLGQILFWQAQTPDALAEEFMKQWKNSSGHNDNMLLSDAVDVGIGVAQGGDRYYAVMVLGVAGC